MDKLEELIWSADFIGPTRRDRRPCRYFVYRPDNLAGRRFAFDGDVAADVGRLPAAPMLTGAAIAGLAVGSSVLSWIHGRSQQLMIGPTTDAIQHNGLS